MSQRTTPSPDPAAGSGTGVGRRAFLGSATALAALTSSTALTTAPQVQPGGNPSRRRPPRRSGAMRDNRPGRPED